MIDPLRKFNWHTLYNRYDALCKDFSPAVPYLAAIRPRPQSDRELYYCLLERIHSERNSPEGITLETYEALLYWKYYSQPAAIVNVCKKVRQDPERSKLRFELKKVSHSLPDALTRNKNDILCLVLNKFNLLGLKSQDALPTRTAFLHMIYPNIVPVFDQMVLKAVGAWDSKYANKSIKHLEKYLEYAWELAEKHSTDFPTNMRETPLRLIDMALWVTRDSGKGKTSPSKNSPESSGPLSKLALPGGLLLVGRIHSQGKNNKDTEDNWLRREIVIRQDTVTGYPRVGDKIRLIDTDNQTYPEIEFIKGVSTSGKTLLGRPSKLKPWFKKHYSHGEMELDTVYLKCIGQEHLFRIYTSKRYNKCPRS